MYLSELEPNDTVYVGANGPYRVTGFDTERLNWVRIVVNEEFHPPREISVPRRWCATQPEAGRPVYGGPGPGHRSSDPDTSRMADEKSQVRADSQRYWVLTAYSEFENLTDYEAMLGSPNISEDSCYWKRCSELRQMGLIEPMYDPYGNILTRKGKHDSERMVCQITALGRSVLGGLRHD